MFNKKSCWFALLVSGLFLCFKTPTDSLSVVVRAIDLTEDFTPASSNNDELILLIFGQSSEGYLLIHSSRSVVDTSNPSIQFDSIGAKDLDSITVVLIEQDSWKHIDAISPVVQVNIEDLKRIHENQDLKELNRLLGSDDLVGIKSISLEKGQTIEFKGVNLFDWYHYELSFD